MISYNFKILFCVLISVILVVPLNADDDECTPELQVRRNTVHTVDLGAELRIECPVLFCNNLPPKICWYKVKKENICLNENNNNHIKTGWKTSAPSKGIFYLLFQSISSNDSGGYQCRGGGSVSHIINISVYGTKKGTNTEKTTTNVTNNQPVTEPADTFLIYMYSTAGIGSFVIIVFLISIICTRGCKGKSRTDTTEIQNSPRGSRTQGNVKQQVEELSYVVHMSGQEGKISGR